LVTAKFAFNNKVYIATKLSLFKVNYRRELRMGKISKKENHMKAEEFVKKMKEIYKETKVVLKKLQEEMKNLIWQMKKLIEKFVRSYKIKKIILENAVELELLVSIKIYSVVNVSRTVMY